MADITGTDTPVTTMLRHGLVAGHEQFTPGLRALLLEMAARIPDKGTNRPAGESYFVNKWLSARDLHTLPDAGIRSLVGLIENAANGMSWPAAGPAPLRLSAMWAIVSRNGMEGKPHRHLGRVSGAYYVDAGACDDAGNGAFAVYAKDGRRERLVQPRTGLMLLFPSTMLHGVLRYDSAQPRIVLSFNLA